MTRSGRLAVVAVLMLLSAAGGADAACRATPDGTGGARVRCDDGTGGRLRPDGAGGLRGQVGDRRLRLRDGASGIVPESGAGSRTTGGRGASGFGGVRDNTARNSDGGRSCMSGGLRITDCN